MREICVVERVRLEPRTSLIGISDPYICGAYKIKTCVYGYLIGKISTDYFFTDLKGNFGKSQYSKRTSLKWTSLLTGIKILIEVFPL